MGEERRTVAFLLAQTPTAERCCVLLRAMSQDVHSWLMWQAQSCDAHTSPGPLPRAPRRRSRRRAVKDGSSQRGTEELRTVPPPPRDASRPDVDSPIVVG